MSTHKAFMWFSSVSTGILDAKGKLVDLVGIEPTTSSMPWKRAPSCATGPLTKEGTTLLLSYDAARCVKPARRMAFPNLRVLLAPKTERAKGARSTCRVKILGALASHARIVTRRRHASA